MTEYKINVFFNSHNLFIYCIRIFFFNKIIFRIIRLKRCWNSVVSLFDCCIFKSNFERFDKQLSK